MKKSIINIITLVLVLTNTILTAIMVVVVIQSMNSSNAVISKVAKSIELEKGDDEKETDLAISDTETYDPEAKLTIKLKESGDGKEHYAVIYPQLKLNKKDKDYSKFSKSLDDYKGDITQCVQDVVQQYTAEELQANPDKAREEILVKLREMYDSEFIIGVIFSSTTIQ